MWLIGSIIGSMSLVALNILSKTLPMNISAIPLMGILSLIVTFSFWYAWQNSNGFLFVFALQSLMVNFMGVIAAHHIIKERLNLQDVIGYTFIFLMLLLLRFK